jgi:hypothetical protein
LKLTHPDMQALAARMDKLELQNRRWKLASLLLGLASISFLLTAARPADHFDQNVLRVRTVEAQDFVLKDADGQVYARLTLNPKPKEMNGAFVLMSPALGPALQFYNEKGVPIWSAPQEPSMVPAR